MTIKFYGAHDMSSGWYLQEVETFFRHWDEKIHAPDLKTILELYNIKRYIDTGLRLTAWTDEQFAGYQERCKVIPQILGRYFSTVTDENLQSLCQTVDWEYADDFWQLICDYKVYLRITSGTIEALLNSNENFVWYILRHKALSETFGQVLADHLTHNSNTAEELLSQFFADHTRHRQLHFPKEFTQAMRDQVLWDYVERDDANLNYLQLLERSQSSKEFPLSDKLKLRARRKKEELQEKLFADRPGFSYDVEVTFKSIPDGSIEEVYREKDHVYSYAYSKEWLQENQDYPTLLNNFIYLFKYVDLCFRSTFVSRKAELSPLESHLGVKGKKDYIFGSHFNTKEMRSLLQMIAYREELQRLGIQIEPIFQWFFETYLKEEFGAEGFTYAPPSSGTTYFEKCKLLASAIDGILKQYRLFCEDGQVDRELLEMSSGHVIFREIPSIMKNKYAYSGSETVEKEMYLLFSDQSMMYFTEKTKDQYRTLPKLLLSENMKKEDFAYYQQGNLDWLIDRGSVRIADDGRLLIHTTRASVLGDLFYNEVVCPSYYDEGLRKQVDEFIAAGDMRYENTLFSKPEQDYLNYALNKSEFSNGLDLRNKYSHDTCSLEESQQRQDYMELLKIMVLIVIKINEEFCWNSP